HRWALPGPGRLPAILVGAAVLLSIVGIGGWLATRGTTAGSTEPTLTTCATSPPSSAEPLPAIKLSGTYDVKMTLLGFTKDTLGTNKLWGEPHPRIRV